MAVATSDTTKDAAGTIRSGYEIANALGRLNADRPKLGDRCLDAVPVAKAIRFMLHALDLHMQATGLSAEGVARQIRDGKIELRLNGNMAVVVCP